MFDFDTLRPEVLLEPEGFMAREKDLRRLAVSTSIHSLRRRPLLMFAPETSVAHAAKVMAESGSAAALVVCSGSVLGLLSDSDITAQLQISGVDLAKVSVWQAMTPEPPSCLDTDSVATVLRLFKTFDVRFLPMVKQYGPAVGIVEMSSVVEWLADQFTVVGLD
jgi:predicted transcriptional regulator